MNIGQLIGWAYLTVGAVVLVWLLSALVSDRRNPDFESYPVSIEVLWVLLLAGVWPFTLLAVWT